ncbi:MAG TPA: enoyl-CoA hydratase-related protein [Ramlibacter sp.]|nr:enoyl-CoA hydratase-related protein [Ramlibacter sp.]
MTDFLKFEIDEGVATITLNRPEKLNAFTAEMLEDWLRALEDCRTNPEVRVIVMTGAGRAFTTGGDVEGFAASAQQTPAGIKSHLVNGGQRLPRKLAEIDKPIIAALNGFATGGGLDIALACDIRFAAESARFAETYAKMGLIPGMGGAWLLPRVVGVPKALEMFWSCDWVDAREAERIGLVNKVYPDAELMEATQAFARKVANGAPLSVQTIKKLVRMGGDQDLPTALDAVATHMTIVRTSEDHKEALAAFKEKRTPKFTGS